MNNTYLLYGLVVAVAALTGLLTTLVFVRKSLASTHIVKLVSGALVAIVAGVAIFETYIRPPLPEAFAQCEQPSRYAPTTITCLNRSEDYSRIEWSFGEGKVNGEGESIQRQVTTPGAYVVTVTAYGKWPATDISRTHESKFVVEAEPRREPERKTVIQQFSRSSTGGGAYQQIFSADPGFKIVDASLKVTSASAGQASIVRRTENEVMVAVQLQPKPSFRGLTLKMERAWVTAEVTLTLERLP